jgi:hypothetical protein
MSLTDSIAEALSNGLNQLGRCEPLVRSPDQALRRDLLSQLFDNH